MLGDLFKSEFMLYPTEEVQGIVGFYGETIDKPVFPTLDIEISYIEGNDNKSISNKKLYRLGLVSMLAIIMHNIPEGIATFLSSSTNKGLGLSLALAISFHNIPEGISIAIPIYFSTKSKRKAFFYTLISGLSEPLGAILAYLFLSSIINNFIMSIILSIIAGIMIHISIYELLS